MIFIVRAQKIAMDDDGSTALDDTGKDDNGSVPMANKTEDINKDRRKKTHDPNLVSLNQTSQMTCKEDANKANRPAMNTSVWKFRVFLPTSSLFS